MCALSEYRPGPFPLMPGAGGMPWGTPNWHSRTATTPRSGMRRACHVADRSEVIELPVRIIKSRVS